MLSHRSVIDLQTRNQQRSGNDWSEAAWQPEQSGTAALLALPEGPRTVVILMEDPEISAI